MSPSLKPFCVTTAVISLLLLSAGISLQRMNDEAYLDRFFRNIKPCDTPVATIPSLIMSDKGRPVVDMLSAHDIMWSSGGSLSHTVDVPAEDAERARQLIFDQFPAVEVIWLPYVFPSQEQ